MCDGFEEKQKSMKSDESSEASAELTAEEYYRKGDELLKFGDYENSDEYTYRAAVMEKPEKLSWTPPLQSNDSPIVDYRKGPFPAGSYTVGVNIPAGRYDLHAISGSGGFSVYSKAASSWMIGNPIGISTGSVPPRFFNLKLLRGDKLEINGSIKVQLYLSGSDKFDFRDVLFPGIYRFGRDIPTGKYNIEVLSGEGDVLIVDIKNDVYTFFSDMAANDPLKADKFHNLVCTRNDELWINGNLRMRLVPLENNDT